MRLITSKSAFEWSGCITGLAGALVLAMNAHYSGWGWVLFLISNGCWIAYGIITRSKGMIAMQVGFALTSGLGIFNSLIK